jgi:hypothetical protein
MDEDNERRTEQRLRYHWPIWFAEDFNGELSQGQMADISSTSAAFTCYAHEACPNQGQYITTRFSVPRYGLDNSFDLADFIRSGHVYRVDYLNGFLRRIAVIFNEPLPFRPGDQRLNELRSDIQHTQPVVA